jgi:hypothetical protein
MAGEECSSWTNNVIAANANGYRGRDGSPGKAVVDLKSEKKTLTEEMWRLQRELARFKELML